MEWSRMAGGGIGPRTGREIGHKIEGRGEQGIWDGSQQGFKLPIHLFQEMAGIPPLVREIRHQCTQD